MSWNVLNAYGIFEFIDYMIEQGLHENCFILNAVDGPPIYDVSNLPDKMLSQIKSEAIKRHGRLKDPFMLKYSYEAIIKHCEKPRMNKQTELKKELETLDARRKINSRQVFPKLYEKVLD
jgi:hypothetical protein